MSAPDHGPHRSRRFLLLLKGRPHMSQSSVGYGWVGTRGEQLRNSITAFQINRDEPEGLAFGPECHVRSSPCPGASVMLSSGINAVPDGSLSAGSHMPAQGWSVSVTLVA